MSALRQSPPPCWALVTDVGAYDELSAQERATSVRKAKWMLHFERVHGLFTGGLHSGPGHFAERHGSTADLGRMELDLGHALEDDPGLEDEVLSGAIPVASAAVLGRVSRENLARPGDDWLQWGRTMSTRQLRREYVRRRDEKLAGEAVYTVISYLTPSAMDDLARCRVLVSRSLKRSASNGQTITVLAREYRRRHDPLLANPGTRRVPDTSGVPGRYVPAEVDREVRARSDDGCRFVLCDNDIWVDRAHHAPHRKGGSREASNLHLLCKRHHKLFDLGRFRIEGTPENPIFLTLDGRPIDGRTPYFAGDDALAAAHEGAAVAKLVEKAPPAPPAADDDPEPPAPPKAGRTRSAPPERDHGPPPPAASPPSSAQDGSSPDVDDDPPLHLRADGR